MSDKGFLKRLSSGLARSRKNLNDSLGSVLSIGRKVDDDFIEDLEAVLISSDMGPSMAMKLAQDVQERYKSREIEHVDEMMTFIKEHLKELMGTGEDAIAMNPNGVSVVLVIGVNGTGKTTTCAKLAHLLKKQGCSVLLGACDTYRAAATEQLVHWAEIAEVDIVRHGAGADPSAVAFDAAKAAVARGVDYLIIDTAGRLHNKAGLMRELEKIDRVLEKHIPSAPHEVLLVLDGTTGQNALAQGKTFDSACGVTGLTLTKLDGTAKGGIALRIKSELKLPIKLIGTGESIEDLDVFEPEIFVDSLFDDMELKK